MEQGTGIEPAFTAWEAVVLPIYEPCVKAYCSTGQWKIQPFSVETFFDTRQLYFTGGRFYVLPLWEITKLAKKLFFQENVVEFPLPLW